MDQAHNSGTTVRIRAPKVYIGGAYVAVAGRDGTDYVRFCRLHRWASLPSVSLTTLTVCPFCAAELDEATKGRARYDDLQRRLMPVEAR